MEVIPFNILLNIINNFQQSGNVIRKFVVSDVMNLLATCKILWQYRTNDNIWFMICSQFNDFARMRATKVARNASWRDIYTQRLNNLLHERFLVIGDPADPEYKVSVYIYGDGRCFINKTKCKLTIYDFQTYFSDSDSDSEYEIMRMTPIKKYKTTHGEHYDGITEIIDAHAANSTILLLCQSGQVLEMMFTPSWVNEYNKFHVPVLVNFPQVQLGEYIIMIRALAVGNFAVSSMGKVFVWTIFDHPITMEKIHTEPIYLQQLQGVLANIYDIRDGEPDGEPDIPGIPEHHTRIDYREARGRNLMTGEQLYEDMYIDIANDQIMMLIMESYFSADDVDEIAHTIAAQGDPG